ncbi:MAG: hypothetical protein ACRDYU_00370 [Actinomycetes bacterium]
MSEKSTFLVLRPVEWVIDHPRIGLSLAGAYLGLIVLLAWLGAR